MTYTIFATLGFETADARGKALTALKAHRDRCLANEPGTLQFELSIANHDDRTVLLFEAYESREAFEAHWNGESNKQGNKELEALGVKMSISATHGTKV